MGTKCLPCSQGYINPLILSLLQQESSCRILDLGCGNVALCRYLAFNGFDVVGVEPDAQGVSIAREQAPGASFYQLGVDDEPSIVTQAEGLFDAVVSTEVIEHLYSPHLLPRFALSCLNLVAFWSSQRRTTAISKIFFFLYWESGIIILQLSGMAAT